MTALPDTTPLAEARAWLRERLDGGEHCPCCTQRAQVYRRKINSGMAVSLIVMWKAARTDWQHVPTTVGGRSREEGKLRYWGLVEEQSDVQREDGGRAGWWRITEFGAAFVCDRVKVRKYARVYDGRCLGLEGDLVGIRDALNDRFDYAELMAGGAA